ncbi:MULTISPECIES: TlpA family protein disulfide reductase [Glycomyces]|uniref:Thiol-disulfide isomerase/thioredoxin n=2 Tax=Glycomyces TaxID=58113 RepID=A0A9X3PM23_9ACTN|nr:TlpA disulfide reductase family protein [Glycomyces lechevalierae]MDA1387267.1 TlpA disulfide reductase family protein [Glycomyces lechevalierae]MDR7338469.1 thiol-disulfide isomerase/thioredoxin [Glycomyces lechevalierae]
MALRRRTMLAAVPLLALAACSESGGENSDRANEINRDRFVSGDGSNYRWEEPDERFAAPRLTGEDLDGNPIDTDDWAGSVLVVNFWGSWCPPCVAEAPYLVEAAAEFQDQGVQFLGVNIRDTGDAAQAFENRWAVTYPSLSDEAGRVADQFVDYGLSPNDIPATIVIDAEHRVFSIWRGGIDDAETLIADVRKALEPA